MYQALYRKYRPAVFDDVVGQNVVVNTLKNAINYNHINHAYLFSGPRGTGKTTIAKIFARSVNCLEPVDGVACGKCKNCLYSFSKECMDIIEIDAASNNGVDEIRELRSKVGILPSELKYKVYIIDEVHMLSIGAFNALLKTIEEPPEHVIFILATTDPQKIPATIISRCQWYSFKKISNDDIVKRLKEIVNDENIKVDEKVLEKIAQASDGGLRDAIGLLDKLRAYCTDEITLDDFYEINGEVNEEELKKLEKLIFSFDVSEVLSLIEKYYREGKNLVQVVKQFMILIKDELFNHYINGDELIFEESELVNFLNLLNEHLVELKKADDVRLSIEIFLLHYMNEHKNPKTVLNEEVHSQPKSTEEVYIRPKKEEKTISTEAVEKQNEVKILSTEIVQKTNEQIKKYEELMLIRSKNTMIEAVKDELNKETVNLNKLNDYTFDPNNGYLACELLDGKVRASSPKNIIISYDYEGMVDKLSNHFNKLNDFYNEKTGSLKKIAFITTTKWNELKQEYISLHKQGKQFEYQEEPILNSFEEDVKINNESDDLINQTIEMFGDLVEVE